jgi:hypothetical protein
MTKSLDKRLLNAEGNNHLEDSLEGYGMIIRSEVDKRLYYAEIQGRSGPRVLYQKYFFNLQRK